MRVLHLPVPSPYDFLGCVGGHGWVSLEPFQRTETGFRRVESLASGRVVVLTFSAESADGELGDPTGRGNIRIEADTDLADAEAREVLAKSRHMLRLDEDFAEFYDLCRQAAGPYSLALGKGRLIRSPSVFEDAFKVITTTNVTWRQTKAMVARTVAGLGAPAPNDPSLRAFPTPAAVLSTGAAFLKNEARLGYRAEAVLAVAERADELETLRTASLPPEELRRTLLAFKGIGPYASATLAMLLGSYEFIPVDSEALAFAAKKYFGGNQPTRKAIEGLYEPWGRWKYLGYWLDSDGPEFPFVDALGRS
ncbi:MAG: hypothetical protein M0Z94_06495, partial [Dehalococcoidales bacterium]|nr:hypothetical protein [Dehalococcoidales bacterium]